MCEEEIYGFLSTSTARHQEYKNDVSASLSMES